MNKILNNTSRAKQATISMVVAMISYMLIAGAWIILLQQLTEIQAGNFSNRDFFLNLANGIDIASWCVLGIYLVNGIIFMHWFRRAYGNLHRYGVNDLRKNEDMAVWGWVIPIQNFFVPKQIMVDIWKGYNQLLVKVNSPNSNQNASTSTIDAWWAVWVIGTIASIIGPKMIEQPTSVVVGIVFILIGLGSRVLAGILLIGLMKKVKEMEQEVWLHKDEITAEAREIHLEKVKIAKAKAAQVQAAAQQRRAGMRPPR